MEFTNYGSEETILLVIVYNAKRWYMVETRKKRSDFYDNVFSGEEFRQGKKKRGTYLDKYAESVHYKYIAERFEEERFDSVLEIGVGGGLTLKHIHEKCPNVEMAGMDISKKILNNTQEHFKQWNMDVTTFMGDAYNMPDVKDNKYDTVLLIDVIEHLEDPVGALIEANRIAKKEVIIHVPSRQSIWTFLSPKLRQRIVHLETVIQYWLGHYRLYTFKSLKQEVKKASMDIIDYRSIKPISVNIYPFWRITPAESLVTMFYKAGLKFENTSRFNPKFIANSILAFCRKK